ncbi:hypothetical protein JCM16303_007328 [Sporobolomyces ruberrimus]
MDFSKGPIQQFIRGTSSTAHRDQLASEPPQASTSSSFRQAAAASTVEDDFGSFLTDSSSSHIKERPYESSWNAARTRNEVAERGGDQEWRGTKQDGFEIQELLGSDTTLDDTEGDWERELLESQRRNHFVDSSLPLDPLLPSSSTSRLPDLEHSNLPQHLSGDLSPTSASLLSSLSSLDLSTLAYLRTLLSLPPEQAIQRYFDSTTSSYTEDVWGLPRDVKEVFEKGRGADGNVEDENGREKAVRRLGMLMKHLQLADTSSTPPPGQAIFPIGATKGKGKASELGNVEAVPDAADLARDQWAKDWEEYPLAASHVRSPPKSYFVKSLPPLSSPPSLAPIKPYADSPKPSTDSRNASSKYSDRTSHSESISVPSSLSSEAFVVHSCDRRDDRGYPEGVYHEVPGKGTS